MTILASFEINGIDEDIIKIAYYEDGTILKIPEQGEHELLSPLEESIVSEWIQQHQTYFWHKIHDNIRFLMR